MKHLFFILTTLIFFQYVNAGVYVIGDFNDWKLPDAVSDNGAKRLYPDPDSMHSILGETTFYLPEGSHKFSFVSVSNDTFSVKGYYSASNPDFKLTNVSGANDWPDEWMCPYDHYHFKQEDFYEWDIIKSFTYQKDFSKVKPFQIIDWQGGMVSVSTTGDINVFFWSEDAPLYEPITKNKVVYALVKIDDCEPELIELPYVIRKRYCFEMNIQGKNISILFTTEKSLNPSLENCWGTMKEEIFEYDETKKVKEERIDIDFKRGGKPYNIQFKNRGNVYIGSRWYEDDGIMSLTGKNQMSYYAEIKTNEKKWTESLEIDPATGFFAPLSVEGKDISVQFTGYDPKKDRTFLCGLEYCKERALHTDEKYPEFPYDKVEFTPGAVLPYEAKFQNNGFMTIKASPLYGIAYISYEGNLKQSADIVEVIDDEFVSENLDNDEDTKFYDLTGNLVINPTKGIYLVKVGNKYRKILKP